MSPFCFGSSASAESEISDSGHTAQRTSRFYSSYINPTHATSVLISVYYDTFFSRFSRIHTVLLALRLRAARSNHMLLTSHNSQLSSCASLTLSKSLSSQLSLSVSLRSLPACTALAQPDLLLHLVFGRARAAPRSNTHAQDGVRWLVQHMCKGTHKCSANAGQPPQHTHSISRHCPSEHSARMDDRLPPILAWLFRIRPARSPPLAWVRAGARTFTR